MHSHTEIYEHSPECPKYTSPNRRCTCERKRYRNVLILGILFAGIEYGMGVFIQSDAIRGDALHLVCDVITDIVAWTVAGLAFTFPNLGERYRAWGGYVQAFMLVVAASLIVREVYVHPDPERINAPLMIIIGSIAAYVNWRRFKILHPKGSIWKLLRKIFQALIRGKKELTTYIGEIFHIILDIGVSIIAALGGVAILYSGDNTYDNLGAWVMAGLVLLGAVVVVIFASRHNHNTDDTDDCDHNH